MATYHVVMTIPYAERAAREGVSYFEREGQPVSPAEALKELAELRQAGFAAVPACEAHDETGRCTGHSDRR